MPNTIFIETSRLIIAPPSMDDFAEICQLNADREVMHYINPQGRPPAEVQQFLKKAIDHFQKYGFSFGTVFEKSSGKLIGQAGMIYLNYDDTQPDIEIGYRLYASYWNKGYATELSKALLQWGFKNIATHKLVAVINPENDRSRRVLEKIGMHYVGRAYAYNMEVSKYEIAKPMVNFAEIKLLLATMADYSIIQNMGRFYVYDMSEYLGWDIGDNGLYECNDFKKYLDVKDTFPFLIQYQKKLVGFVIVNKKGSDDTIEFNMAEFFILQKFKHQKIGRYVAEHCFRQFQGIWEVMVMPGNEGAYRFWRSTIIKYTHHHFMEYTRNIAHFNGKTFNIFKFDSR